MQTDISGAQIAKHDLPRYFVIKIVDDNGRSAFIGIGFSDRSDSFDLNVALQDHFKGVTKEAEIAKVYHSDCILNCLRII